MKPITVRPCTVADVESAPNMALLLAEYGAESAIPELGPVNPQFPLYKALEANGSVRMLGAFHDGELVGFMAVLVSVLPHFGVVVGTSESYFVASHDRKSGAGLDLLHAAEDMAREMGAIGFFVSTPVGSRLERVMPGVGYRDTNRVFFKALA
ncbi:GNAT family N-acetyltransferase [Ralstonia syzygii]|uniref:GNAT family N-acetyltransferase n=1 Tax=Ralstonia syzygii TaxID=28097 RepID=UPI00351618D1